LSHLKVCNEFILAINVKPNPIDHPRHQPQAKFVPPAERIVTFDQDGTLWISHPMYTQVMYCLELVPALVKAKPELAKVDPFKTVMSGNRD
jgi:hypothetical protein